MRMTRGLAALLALLTGLVGIPWSLVALAGNPLPAQVSWRGVTEALLRPDDGSILIAVIAIAGWLAWLVWAISVLTELVSLVSGFRIRIAIPGLAGPQRLAAGLLLAVTALISAPVGAVHADPPPVVQTATALLTEKAAVSPEIGTTPLVHPDSVTPVRQGIVTRSESGMASHVHVVKFGDDLWSLAEHYYGQGREWRKIAAANPRQLSGGPDRLQPGWKLAIPARATHLPSHEQSVMVRPGDSLSSIAREVYGHEARWTTIFDANRFQIDDPDNIAVGTRLVVPPDAATIASRSEEAGHRSTATNQPDTGTRVKDQSGESNPGSVDPTAQDEEESGSKATARPRVPPDRQAATATVPNLGPAEPTATGIPVTTSRPAASDLPAPPRADVVMPAADIALGVGSVGGLLAAGVIAALSLRRRTQLQLRPVGRRIQHASAPAQMVETALGYRQQPLTLETLDLATRAIAAHCHRHSVPLPALITAAVSPDRIELTMAVAVGYAPVGFRVVGPTWILEQEDASYLLSVPGVSEAARPYPALVSLGQDAQGRQLLVDVERLGLLSLAAESAADGVAFLAAMAVELSFSLWADEMFLTLLGSSVELPEVLGKHNVTRYDDLDVVLDRLEQRAQVQRRNQSVGVLGQNRVDPDLAEPWAPDIVLISQPLTADQERRLLSVVTGEPRVTVAAVVAGRLPDAPWCLELRRALDTEDGRTATLLPIGLDLAPQMLEAQAKQGVIELVTVTSSEATTPAPWWDHGDGPPSEHPPHNVPHFGKRFGGWGPADTRQGDVKALSPTQAGVLSPAHGQLGGQPAGGSNAVHDQTIGRELAQHSPILRLLGPVDLASPRGEVPPRAGRQCLEYCAWLLEHPGTTALAMASALVIAEGTRRSNMSRLRTWLGVDPDGQPYLPDAYSGRILLHPSVSSDWQRLQILTAAGVNKTSTSGLHAALELVRGAPLADAAPGQWHWAEELRTDMVSVIRDIGVEVSSRALAEHDIDLARWSAARALVAAPGDELLLATRIRTEHLAGNAKETERLTLQLAAQARSLGIDLDVETVVLLQEVMEGRARARMA